MAGLFVFLFFTSLITLVVGLIKPKVFSKLLGENVSRKKVITIFGGVAILFLILVGVTGESEVDSDSSGSEQIEKSEPTIEPVEKESAQEIKKISYEVVSRWSIPNGGEGKRIVISENLLNENDMRLFGDQLRAEAKDDKNATVNIFTDKKAAGIQENFAGVTDEELEWAEKRYVGQYLKNGNSQTESFSIYLNGSNDPTGYITVEY